MCTSRLLLEYCVDIESDCLLPALHFVAPGGECLCCCCVCVCGGRNLTLCVPSSASPPRFEHSVVCASLAVVGYRVGLWSPPPSWTTVAVLPCSGLLLWRGHPQ